MEQPMGTKMDKKIKPSITIRDSDYDGIADLQLEDEVIITCKGTVRHLGICEDYSGKGGDDEYEARLVDLTDMAIKVIGNGDTKKAVGKMLNMNPLGDTDD